MAATEKPINHSDNTRYMGAVGTFDGVHRGHAYALRMVAEQAQAHGLRPCIFTFAGHPLASIDADRAPKTLTTAAQKERLIKAIIPDAEIVYLEPEIFNLTAAGFLKKIHTEYSVDAFAMGYDNHIGRDRRSATDIGADTPVKIVLLDKYADADVSSSAIRRALATGNIKHANELLGHCYTVSGTVVHGHEIGREIGFPTANISTDSVTLLPADGVYAVDVIIADGSRRRGMANIGRRPTVGGHDRTFEVNIFDLEADLYGTTISIEFLGRLRDEQRFDNLAALQRQLAADRVAAEAYYT